MKSDMAFKKIIIIFIVLLFVPLMGLAQEIHGTLEMGTDLESMNSYVDFDISLDFRMWVLDISIFGGFEVWYIPDDFPYNSPFMDIYTIGCKVGYKTLYVELQHWCSHQVVSFPFKKRLYTIYPHPFSCFFNGLPVLFLKTFPFLSTK